MSGAEWQSQVSSRSHGGLVENENQLDLRTAEKDDNKEALASVVDKMFGRHIFSTLRTEMQVSLSSLHCIHIFTLLYSSVT
jgi:hypothetical protein